MSTFKQDLPPPGGYADINVGTQYAFKYIKGFYRLFLLFLHFRDLKYFPVFYVDGNILTRIDWYSSALYQFLNTSSGSKISSEKH